MNRITRALSFQDMRRFATRPGDSEDTATRNALALATAIVCCGCGLIWALLYGVVFGIGLTMALPLLFVAVVGSAIGVSAWFSDPRPLIFALLSSITWISAFIQWSIGSAYGSGLVITWSFLGPIGALIFLSRRQGVLWMCMFLGIVAISVLIDPALLGAPLPVSDRVRSLFLLMNLGVALTVVFAAAAWFVRSIQQEKSRLVDLTNFLKKIFGRFQSDQVLDAIIENPAAAGATGTRQPVTIMMTDLRGFTALGEQRRPEEVVEMLNVYLSRMVDVIFEYGGTVVEIIGDALLVTFGAPRALQDRVARAVACAVRMQNEMAAVNGTLESRGLPDLHMGIGIHDAEVVVGVIGSERRAKYGVVGSGVNIASRIESHTTAGQVLVSQSVVDAIGELLRIDGELELRPKGSELPLAVYDVGGIAGEYQLNLRRTDKALIVLAHPMRMKAFVVRGKLEDPEGHDVQVTHLSESAASIVAETPIEVEQTIRLDLCDVPERLRRRAAYAKVIGRSGQHYEVAFTSVAPELAAYFLASMRLPAK